MSWIDWKHAVLNTIGREFILPSDETDIYPAFGHKYKGDWYWAHWTTGVSGTIYLYKNHTQVASYSLADKTSHINGACTNLTAPVVFKEDKAYYVYISLTQSGSGPYTSTLYLYEYDFATDTRTETYTAVLNTEASGTNSDNYAHAAIALDDSTGKLYTAASCYLLKAGVNTKIFRYTSAGVYEDYVVANTTTGVPYVRLQVSDGTIYWGGNNRMDYISGAAKGTSFGTNVYSAAGNGAPRLAKLGLYSYSSATQKILRLAGETDTWDVSSYADNSCHVWLVCSPASKEFVILVYDGSTTLYLLYLDGAVTKIDSVTVTSDYGSTKCIKWSPFEDINGLTPHPGLAMANLRRYEICPTDRDVI